MCSLFCFIFTLIFHKMNSIENIYEVFLQHSNVCTDTRNIQANSIFFALKGANFNGNKFADQALELGAAFVVIDEAEYKKDDRYLLVDDVLKTLQELARFHRDRLDIPFIGITGSNGKTTSKELLNAVLSRKYKTHATKGNLNNHIGVPLTILSITADVEIAIIEMGANHQHEIEFLCNIADPEFGLICNVGKAHLEGMGGFEGVKKTKKELYDYIQSTGGVIFVNGSDENLMQMSMQNDDIVYFGNVVDSVVSGKITQFDPFLSVKAKINSSNEELEIKTQLVGDYNLNNVLASICIGHYFRVPFEEMKAGIESYAPSNNRSQAIKIGTNNIVMDAYNANPSSMSAAILNFVKLQANTKLLILGDMFEMGDESMKEHSDMIELVHAQNLQNVIFVGKDFYANKKYNYTYFQSTEEAKEFLKNNKPENTSILVKGSRGMKLESLTEVF